MFLDQLSVLVAIGFSGASLGVTFLLMWTIGRSEMHFLIWSIGLAIIVAGVAVFGTVVEHYSASALLVSFLLLMTGFGFLHAGCARFCAGQANWTLTIAFLVFSIALTSAAFALGYSGIGTMISNAAIGTFLILIARHYWLARAESPLLMIANAICCIVTAASFLACAFALAEQGQLVLTSRPSNWAEEINSIVAIAGLTGIGALSLTVHQMRIAQQPQVGCDERRADRSPQPARAVRQSRRDRAAWNSRGYDGSGLLQVDQRPVRTSLR